jgi:hypothetical protein
LKPSLRARRVFNAIPLKNESKRAARISNPRVPILSRRTIERERRTNDEFARQACAITQ